MDINRKIQLVAGAVVANGLLALTVMSPSLALANPCAPKQICTPSCTIPPASNLKLCQNVAPPGCTATSFTCYYSNGCHAAFLWGLTCRYD